MGNGNSEKDGDRKQICKGTIIGKCTDDGGKGKGKWKRVRNKAKKNQDVSEKRKL